MKKSLLTVICLMVMSALLGTVMAATYYFDTEEALAAQYEITLSGKTYQMPVTMQALLDEG